MKASFAFQESLIKATINAEIDSVIETIIEALVQERKCMRARATLAQQDGQVGKVMKTTVQTG